MQQFQPSLDYSRRRKLQGMHMIIIKSVHAPTSHSCKAQLGRLLGTIIADAGLEAREIYAYLEMRKLRPLLNTGHITKRSHKLGKKISVKWITAVRKRDGYMDMRCRTEINLLTGKM